MNNSQLLALVGRIESLVAEKTICESKNLSLSAEVVELREVISNMKDEVKALNDELWNERSVSGALRCELFKLKDLISEGPVTVQLPNVDNFDLKVSLIKFIRQFAITDDGHKMGLKDAKYAVESRMSIALPAAIIPDYNSILDKLSEVKTF
jgi:hypothetical protein